MIWVKVYTVLAIYGRFDSLSEEYAQPSEE